MGLSETAATKARLLLRRYLYCELVAQKLACPNGSPQPGLVQVAQRTDTASWLKVLVSEDRLQAWIVSEGTAPADAGALSAEDILALATRAHISITDAVRSRVGELPAVARTGLPERCLIAEGQAPVNAEDGKLEWSPELARMLVKPDQAERVDYFAPHGIVTVSADTVIGRILPPADGTEGVDVFGSRHNPRKSKGTPLKLGAGVMLAGPDSDQVVASTAGRVLVESGKVSIVEVLEVPGDVDFGTGSVEACVDVHVTGTVRSKFSVRTPRSLHVDRVIEAADVHAGRDIVVRGGIFGQERTGRVRAGGDVSAKLFNEVDLEAAGSVQFEKEILNSRVRVQGRLSGPRGTVIGGHTYAREGIEVCVLGSEGCVTTCTAIGTDVNVLRRIRRAERQVRELNKKASQIREIIQPLLANAKRLLPAQRERATELLCKADEIEQEMDTLRQQAQQWAQDAAPRGTPAIIVADTVYPGVRITIHARELRVQSLLRGPLKFELRKVQDASAIVALNQRTGSVTVLPSIEVDLDAPPADEPAQRGNENDAKQPIGSRHPA